MKNKIAFVIAGAAGLASMIHPFGSVRSGERSAPLLAGASAPSSVLGILSGACQNCHSEKTEWPVYSRIAPLSWMIEKDVRDAREHMNLSRWNDYDFNRQQELLSKIGSLVRNHGMPPARYLLLHPEARLTIREADQIYQWTRAERKRLRAADPPPEARSTN